MPRAIFLGGLFSAVLVGVAFASYETNFERLIPWFALVPLLISLHRNRDNERRRWLHGACFGWILCAWCLHPLVQASLARTGGSQAGIVDLLTVVGKNGATWFALTFLWGVFAWATGPLFRSRFLTVPLLCLPLFWVGLEYLRTSVFGSVLPWLVLGETIDPGTPESFVAATLGVVGLSAAVVFANTAFALLLREKHLTRQVLLAALGCSMVLYCFLHGYLRAPDDENAELLSVGIVQKEAAVNNSPLLLARKITGSRPSIIVFGLDAFLVSASRQATFEAKLASFAGEEDVSVLAGVARTEADEAADPGASSGRAPSDDGGSPARSFSRPDITSSGILYVSSTHGITARLGDLPRSAEETPPDTLSAAVLDTMNGKLGVGPGRLFDSSTVPRLLVAQGAQVLLALDRDSSGGGRLYAAMRARMHAFRALENGVVMVRSTLGGTSGSFDATGRSRDLAVAGAEWANVSPVALRSLEAERTAFSRWGWIFGPICLGLTAGLTVGLVLLDLASRRSADA